MRTAFAAALLGCTILCGITLGGQNASARAIVGGGVTQPSAAPAETVADLGKSLTPFGAIRAGNADGTIPAWTGGLTARTAPGTDPFVAEKPLFTITAANVGQYEDKLAAGTVAMLKTLPQFRVDVYPTHRTAAMPQYIYDNAIGNASHAQLVHDGQDVQGASLSVPFPIPHNGSEAIWNHILRWRGTGISRTVSLAITTPTGDYQMQRWLERIFVPYGVPSFQNDKKWDSMFWSEVVSPARTAGLITLAISYQNPNQQPRQAWQYYPGERRVRRAPEISYDTPYNNTDGLATVDDYDMFNGAIDRYDWKLVGRKEVFVPYNDYKFQDPHYRPADLIKKDCVNPDAVRWELHRVWVVEASLKPDYMHVYSRRVYYLDEDSWMALISDRYDGRGALWRTAMTMSHEFPDVPGYFEDGHVYMDLYQHRYLAEGMRNQEKEPNYYMVFNPRDFTPEALRRYGRR